MNTQEQQQLEKNLVLASAEQGFTQSEIMAWEVCPQYWFNTYVKNYRKKGSFSWSLVFGSAWHATMESVVRSHLGLEEFKIATLQLPDDVILTQQDEKKFEYWDGVLQVQSERYRKYYADFLEVANLKEEWVEREIQMEWQGIRLRGKLDLIFELDGKLCLKDYKTTSRIDASTITGWSFRFQFMFYSWLMWRGLGIQPERFYIDSMKKPTIRQRQKESFDSFLSRLKGEMIAEPDKYFYMPSPQVITTSGLERFEKEILQPKIDRLKFLLDWASGELPLTTGRHFDNLANAMLHSKDTDSCIRFGSVCQFLPLCQNGDIEEFQYTTKETKHMELDSNEE